MKDGGHISLMGDSSFSNFDEKKYPRGEDDFILQLTKDFTNQGILMKVDSWEKLHKKITYHYWDKYAEEIRKIAGDDQL